MILHLLVACARPGGQGLDATLVDPESTRVETDAWTLLAEGADSLDPGLRGHALGWLVRLDPAPGGGTWGPRAMWDPDPWVVRQAAEGLQRRVDDPVAVEHLVALVFRPSADPYVRGAVAFDLLGAGRTDLGAALADAAMAESTSWRAAPLALAAVVSGDDRPLPKLNAALASGALPLEPEFLFDVGRSGRSDLVDALARGESLAEPEITLAYAGARLHLGDPAAEATFKRALADPDEFVRLDAVETLARIPTAAATALLSKAEGVSGLADVRARLALISRAEAPVGLLEAIAIDGDDEFRAMAMHAAGTAVAAWATDRKAVRTLEKVVANGLRSDNPSVRLAAFGAAGLVPWTELPSAVTEALRDEAQAVRTEAAALTLLAP